MKKFTLLFTLLCVASFAKGQKIPPAPADKAVIYFVKPGIIGMAMSFTFMDSSKVLGKFIGADKYIRVECEPGLHLFWVRYSNEEFLEAEVESGRIYFIEAMPQQNLKPVDYEDIKLVAKIMDILAKKPPEYLTPEQLGILEKETQELIRHGLRQYKKEKDKAIRHQQMTRDMYYKGPTTSQP